MEVEDTNEPRPPFSSPKNIRRPYVIFGSDRQRRFGKRGNRRRTPSNVQENLLVVVLDVGDTVGERISFPYIRDTMSHALHAHSLPR